MLHQLYCWYIGTSKTIFYLHFRSIQSIQSMTNATHTILNTAMSTMNTTFNEDINEDNVSMNDFDWQKFAIVILTLLVPLFILSILWCIYLCCGRRRRQSYTEIPDTQQSGREVGELYSKPFLDAIKCCKFACLHVCPYAST